MNPGGEARKRGQMVVHRGWCQPLLPQLRLPGDHIPLETGRAAVMPVRLVEEVEEALEMEGDLIGHRLRADPGDRQPEIVRHPDGQRVWMLSGQPAEDHAIDAS